MAYNAKKARVFACAYDRFYSIENDFDLGKNGINIFDHAIIKEMLTEFSSLPDYAIETEVQAIAAWFENNGFSVKYPTCTENHFSIRL